MCGREGVGEGVREGVREGVGEGMTEGVREARHLARLDGANLSPEEARRLPDAHLPENRGVVVTEAGSYSRLTNSYITRLKAQEPSRTCNEITEEEEEGVRGLGPWPRTQAECCCLRGRGIDRPGLGCRVQGVGVKV